MFRSLGVAGALFCDSSTCLVFRWSSGTFMLCGGICLLLTTVVNSDLGKNIFAQLGKFAITAASAMVIQYAAEIFPTVVRNSGLGFASFIASIGSMIAPFMGRELVLPLICKLL